jgi:hypothetical protein
MEVKLNNFKNLILKNLNLTNKTSQPIDFEIESLKKLLNDEEKRLKLILNDNNKSISSSKYIYNQLPKQSLQIGPINNNNRISQSAKTRPSSTTSTSSSSCQTPVLLLENKKEEELINMNIDTNNDNNNNKTLLDKDYTADILNNYHNSIFNNNNNNNNSYKNNLIINEGITEASYIGNIKIHEINKNGYYIRLINVSNNIDENISNYLIEQMVSNKPISVYKFPNNLILKAGHTVTVWSNTNDDINEQLPHTFINREQDKWGTGPECITILAKPNGQAISWTTGCHKYGNVGNYIYLLIYLFIYNL